MPHPTSAKNAKRLNIVLPDSSIRDIEILVEKWNAASTTEVLRIGLTRLRKIEEKVDDGYELVLRKGSSEILIL